VLCEYEQLIGHTLTASLSVTDSWGY